MTWNNNDYPVERLDRKTFASALQKGLGRAYLHVVNYGLDGLADLVLKACLHDQSYDPQSEPSKAKWLFSIFHNSPQAQEFSETILTALKTKRDTWDLAQLFELSKELALNGNLVAREVIKEKAFKKASKSSEDEWLGASEWIDLAGIDGAIELAKIYGSRLLRNPEDYVPEDEIFPNKKIMLDFLRRLVNESEKEPALQAYSNYVEQRGSFKPRSDPKTLDKEAVFKKRCEWVRLAHNLDSILLDAKNKKGEFGIQYSQFGRCATKEELEIIYANLLNETDDEIVLRLLWVFYKTAIPRLHIKFFFWANGNNSKLKYASINALSQIKDKKVHELAKGKIQMGKLLGADSGVLGLFIKNYDGNDATLISHALSTIRPAREDIHDLASNIIDLSQNHKNTKLFDCLKWAYENTPCSECRNKIVAQLGTLHQLDDRLLYECQFDSNENIVTFAKTYIKSKR